MTELKILERDLKSEHKSHLAEVALINKIFKQDLAAEMRCYKIAVKEINAEIARAKRAK